MGIMISFLHLFAIDLVITCLGFYRWTLFNFFHVNFYFPNKVLCFYHLKLKQAFFIHLNPFKFIIALYLLPNSTLRDPDKFFLTFPLSNKKFYFFSSILQLLAVNS